MNWRRTQPIIICLIGGVLLGVANVLFPLILTPVIGFALGVLAFARIFMAPGQLSLRRDLLMFGVLVGALLLARLTVQWGCGWLLAGTARCDDHYLGTAGFVDVFSALLPIVFLWSWVRVRLVILWVAERRER